MDQTGLTKGNLSSHTAKLEACGYITIEKASMSKVPRTVYRLTDRAEALREYRDHMAEVFRSLG